MPEDKDLEILKKALTDYYSDTSRSQKDTKEGLEEIEEDIRIMKETLQE